MSQCVVVTAFTLNCFFSFVVSIMLNDAFVYKIATVFCFSISGPESTTFDYRLVGYDSSDNRSCIVNI